MSWERRSLGDPLEDPERKKNVRLGVLGSGKGEVPAPEVRVWRPLRLTFQNAGGGVTRTRWKRPPDFLRCVGYKILQPFN